MFNSFERYQTLAFNTPEMEGVLWVWKDGSNWLETTVEKTCLIEDTFVFNPDLLTEKETRKMIDLSKGAYSLQVDPTYAQEVQIKSTSQYKNWLNDQLTKWEEKARQLLGDLPEIKFHEWIHVAEERGELDSLYGGDPYETMETAIELFGVEAIANVALPLINTSNIPDWVEYVQDWGSFQSQIDAEWKARDERLTAELKEREAKIKADREQQKQLAKQAKQVSLSTGKPKPVLKRK